MAFLVNAYIFFSFFFAMIAFPRISVRVILSRTTDQETNARYSVVMVTCVMVKVSEHLSHVTLQDCRAKKEKNSIK